MTTNRQVLQSSCGNPSPRINQIIAQFDDIQPRTEIRRLTFITSPDYPMAMNEYIEFSFNFPYFKAGGSAPIEFKTEASLGKDLRVVVE